MSECVHDNSNLNADIDFLDILAILFENWKVLLGVPLMATIAAFFGLQEWPKTYESYAMVSAMPRISLGQAEGQGQGLGVHQMVALLNSEEAVRAIQKRLGWQEDAVLTQKLQGALVVSVDRSGVYVKISAKWATPEIAQKIVQAAVAEMMHRSRPSGSLRARLEAYLESERARLAQEEELERVLQEKIKKAQREIAESLSRAYSETVRSISDRKLVILSLESQLEGVAEANILGHPYLPSKPIGPRPILVLVLVFVGAFLATLLFVFARQAWRNAVMSPEGAAKIARIRAAFR